MRVVVLKEEDAWVIRSTRPGAEPLYLEAPWSWNHAAAAVIFRTYESAQRQLAVIPKSAHRGAVLDVVPLAGAMIARHQQRSR
ncbi:hypothetical protein IP86_02755 [Rhodopseudomonas sp. AAP120]|uniref:hypothetical protein n=1 Tax=Rhodopseudomonas TaxID=1073 RepID=UPI0001779708|nr:MULTISPECIES: hypothetical protein [Rhodopseudomonas]ACF00823.1 hypothetical protein Rpal_2305 [Rhodopseudomonas palustris TIE-1]KPG01751.1 hypothetical protein IP86_02755 [Rhodopseudomonas sp. AAP120]